MEAIEEGTEDGEEAETVEVEVEAEAEEVQAAEGHQEVDPRSSFNLIDCQECTLPEDPRTPW